METKLSDTLVKAIDRSNPFMQNLQLASRFNALVDSQGGNLEDNKEATIDASAYTEPVEITPTAGKDGMKKVTVNLTNIPSGGATLYGYGDKNDDEPRPTYLFCPVESYEDIEVGTEGLLADEHGRLIHCICTSIDDDPQYPSKEFTSDIYSGYSRTVNIRTSDTFIISNA